MKLPKNPIWPVMASWKFEGDGGGDGGDGGGGGEGSHWAGSDVALQTWASDNGFKDAASVAKAHRDLTSKHWAGDDKDLQAYVDKKGLKDAASMTKVYRDMETKMGTMVGLPADDANDVAYEKFASKLRGRNVGEYGGVAPEGLPDGVFDEGLAGAMSQGAFDIGLPSKMYKQLESIFWKAQGAQIAELDAKAAEIKAADEKTMRAAWPGGDYAANTALADRAMEKTGLKDLFTQLGIATHPAVQVALHQMSQYLEEMKPPDSKGGDDSGGEEGAWFTDYAAAGKD